ncbi:MAG TPA: hypothetical protein VEQ37_10850, partial [Actinomycetota bacterium]|nr:hypothetical protein [Actinomycetota bacterium]
DQPTEDLPPRDRLGPRRPRAWDRAVDIVRTTKIQPAVRSMRVVMAGKHPVMSRGSTAPPL